jgi:hypothetical protein
MPVSRFESELANCHRPRSSRELMAAGVTRDVLRGPHWRRTSRGFFVPTTDDQQVRVTTQRILDAAPVVGTSAAVTGWAGLFMAGVDVFDGLDPFTGARLPVDAVLLKDTGRTSTSQVRFTRARVGVDEVRTYQGVHTVTAARAAFDAARYAADLGEAVAVADSCLRAGVVAQAGWRAFIGDHAGWTGVERARAAAALADAASRSPWESRLRVFVVVDLRLPRPEVNLPVFSTEGSLLGIPDLLLRDAGVVVEFDGAQHRGRAQHREDNVREEAFEAAGLVVVRADSIDLMHHRDQLGRRLRSAFERGLDRDRRGDRWTTDEPDWWGPTRNGPSVALTDEEKHAIFQPYD